MKRFLFALLCVACTGTAWAQGPQPTATVAVQQGPTIQQSYSGRIFGGSCCTPACAPACTPNCVPACLATKTICVSEPATKITIKINYSSVCEKVCLPKCSFFGPCDSGCDQGNCGHPIQKKYLVKRVCITECPTTKCVPVEVPVCGNQGGVIHRHTGGSVGAPTYVEPTPIPPTKK